MAGRDPRESHPPIVGDARGRVRGWMQGMEAGLDMRARARLTPWRTTYIVSRTIVSGVCLLVSGWVFMTWGELQPVTVRMRCAQGCSCLGLWRDSTIDFGE